MLRLTVLIIKDREKTLVFDNDDEIDEGLFEYFYRQTDFILKDVDLYNHTKVFL